jgi:protein O-mannosyl-transferase
VAASRRPLMTETPNDSRNRARMSLIAVALVLGTFAAYWQTPGHDFLRYDDGLYVTESEETQRGLSWETVRWAFADTSTGNWHPLTRLSHLLDCTLYDMNPAGHHVTSVLIHAANGVLLFWVMAGMTGAVWRSAIVAALFALHPLHVESVAWIAERKDVLCAFFWFLAMGAYARYARKPGVVNYMLVTFTFAGALLSKPMAVTLPVTLLLLDIWPLRRVEFGETKRALHGVGLLFMEKLPLLLISAAYAAATYRFQQAKFSNSDAFDVTLGGRVANALVSYVVYLRRTVLPHDLAVFYPHPLDTIPAWTAIGAALLLLVVTGAVMWLLPRNPYWFVGWFWYLGTLVPVIGLVQAGRQAMADRYTYIPLIGIFAIAVWAASDLAARFRITTRYRTAAAIVPLILCIAGTAWYNAYWRDTEALFTRTVAVTERNGEAYLILAQEYGAQGDTEKAEEMFAIGLRYFGEEKWTGKDPERHFLLGQIAERAGRWRDAERHYRDAAALAPNYSEALNNLGGVLMELGQSNARFLSEARAYVDRAIAANPENWHARINAAYLAAHFHDYPAAVTHYEAALPHDENNPAIHRNLALALWETGERERAIEHAERAVTLDPSFGEAHADLARFRDALTAAEVD